MPPQGPPVYVDLAYLPGSWSARTVDEEFFRRVRSLCYVVSGDDHLKEGVLRPILDALLAGKHQWGTDTQVRPPPTPPGFSRWCPQALRGGARPLWARLSRSP